MEAIVSKGTLYVVATPIGNLGDMTGRAVEILSSVDLIAAEDTRHSAKLLRHFGIGTPMLALHEHNERDQKERLLEQLRNGKSIALISDAGTPLISDPGYPLVHAAHAADIRVVPIPGASAAIAALSASGLPSDRFVFEGFLPPREQARRAALERLKSEARSLIFYEAPHRIIECIRDMRDIFGGEREAAIARELTKHFETIRYGTLSELMAWMERHAEQQQGEFVVLIRGVARVAESNEESAEAERILGVLLQELPVSQAADLASRITGVAKNRLYKRALDLRADHASNKQV
jgi:16S rRNA (cytidine1402-2'-O)-methyltransferase